MLNINEGGLQGPDITHCQSSWDRKEGRPWAGGGKIFICSWTWSGWTWTLERKTFEEGSLALATW